MDGDRPVTSSEDDRLGFTPIAEQLAKAIAGQGTPQGFVFGIEGQWGSGKTTLINLTIEALKSLGDNAPEIIAFSPWLVGHRDELLQTLFDELASAAIKIDPIAQTDEVSRDRHSWWRKWWFVETGNQHNNLRERERIRKAIGPKLRAFGALSSSLGKSAKVLDALGIPYARQAGSVLENSGDAAKALLARGPVSKQKAELVGALNLLSRRIIVFIDDLDRLEPSEASEVLRLVRAVADFPNIIYVLSYDPEVVATNLSKALGVDDGAAFLEKIVQVSFRVPQPEAFDLRRWFRSELQALLFFNLDMSSGRESPISERVAEVIDWPGGNYLHTGRDVARVIAALRLHAVPVLDRIDLADMVWLQLVKIGNPEFYSWIEQYLVEMAAVAGTPSASVAAEWIRVMVTRLEEIFKDENQNLDLGYVRLSDMLPGIGAYGNELEERLFHGINETALAPFIASKRLGSPQHYRYYFAFALPAGALSDERVQAFIELARTSPRDALNCFESLSRETRPQGDTFAELLIDRLKILADRVPGDAIPGIVRTLSDAMDAEKLAVAGDFGQRFAWGAAARLLKALLQNTDDKMRKESLRILFKEGRALGWITSILRDEIFAHGLYGDRARPESHRLLNAEEFNDALNAMFDRYRDTPPEVLLATPELLNLLFAWYQGGRGDDARKWVENQIASDAGLLAFLSRVRGWGALNGVRYYPLRRSELSNFLDFEVVARRLEAIAAGPTTQHFERARASELLESMRADDTR